MNIYDIRSLTKRREDHHLSLMYRLKDDEEYIETYQAGIGLRSNNKIKFKIKTTKLTKVLNVVLLLL